VVWLIQRGLPESPRWLAARGRHAQAQAIVDVIERDVRTEMGRDLPPVVSSDLSPLPTRIRAHALGFTFCWSRLGAMFVGYWVAQIVALYGVTGVCTLIGGATAIIIVGIGALGPCTNGMSLETPSP